MQHFAMPIDTQNKISVNFLQTLSKRAVDDSILVPYSSCIERKQTFKSLLINIKAYMKQGA